MLDDRHGRDRLLTRTRKLIFAGLLIFAAASAAGGYFMRKRSPPEPEVVLPEFKEPPSGPRAPRSDGFGMVIGKTTLAEVESSISARNLSCKDTSVRALMKEARAKQPVDATTSASAKKQSPMEKNPWVRLSCEDTHAAAIADRVRAPGKGRLLYTFDSPELPLRHVSFRRTHRELEAAIADVQDAEAAMRSTYGAPAAVSGKLDPLEKLSPYKATWTWADLTITVSAINYGDRGVDVYEAIEVPWPVRADAPVRKGPKIE